MALNLIQILQSTSSDRGSWSNLRESERRSSLRRGPLEEVGIQHTSKTSRLLQFVLKKIVTILIVVRQAFRGQMLLRALTVGTSQPRMGVAHDPPGLTT